jgi:phosphatidylglycerophosphate synthase
MLDRMAIRLLAPALSSAARVLGRLGVKPDQVTVAGFVIGLGAAFTIAIGQPLAGLALMLVSRVCDGIDGALARLTRPTDRGGFLDITFDFLFYASMPLAFAVADPARNALAASALLAAFIGTGSSFLAFSAIAQRRGLESVAYPDKGIYYLGGLTEATETIACFVAMCLWPMHFAAFAWVFAAMCVLTIVFRIWAGWTTFRE